MNIVRTTEQAGPSIVKLTDRSVADIADLIGDLDTETKAIEAQIKAAKAELAHRHVKACAAARDKI